MIEKNNLFFHPIARRYFPESESAAIDDTIRQNSSRKNVIIKEISYLPDFPENLKEVTANVVSFLEIALDRTIKPFDGGAISVLNWHSSNTIRSIGSDIRDSNCAFVAITEDRMIGRFVFNDETLIVDYQSNQVKPDVISHNQKHPADKEMLTRMSTIDNSQIVTIRI